MSTYPHVLPHPPCVEKKNLIMISSFQNSLPSEISTGVHQNLPLDLFFGSLIAQSALYLRHTIF